MWHAATTMIIHVARRYNNDYSCGTPLQLVWKFALVVAARHITQQQL
jgi:hypothetical protein